MKDSTLRRLVTEGFMSFLGHSSTREVTLLPGCDVILSNEDVADLNYVVAWDDSDGGQADGKRQFADVCGDLTARGLPFVSLLFPSVATGDPVGKDVCESNEGMEYAVDFPFMVLGETEAAKVDPSVGGNPEVVVRRAGLSGRSDDEALASATVIGSAFGIPADVTLRAIPTDVIDLPSCDVYLASIDGDTVGSVTLTYHGDVCGVWCMATDAKRQKLGIGQRLLSSTIADARDRLGMKQFFLGATPAGYKLYETFGFKTQFSTPAYVYGETHQG